MKGDHMFSGPMFSAPHRLREIPRPGKMLGSPLTERLVMLVDDFDDKCQQLDSLCLGDGRGKPEQGEFRRIGSFRTSFPGLVALQVWALARKVSELEGEATSQDVAPEIKDFVRTWSDQYDEMEIGLRKCVPPRVMNSLEECLAQIGKSWEETRGSDK